MKLCFTTIVYDWYQDLIPIYVYSIIKSFPQHYSRIFSKDKLTQENKDCLELIRKTSDRFEVIDQFDEMDKYHIPHQAANRFLLTRDYFSEFDYVYIGDIDFLIYNQFNDQFYDHYVDNCNKTNFPFSNSWWNDQGRLRMTGLHFIIKQPYFDSMDEQIEKMKSENEFRSNYKMRNPNSFDEEMLFYMLSQKFDLQKIKMYERPLHGVHLGVFRHDLKFCISNKDWSHQSQCIKDISKIDPILKSEVFEYCYKRMRPEAKSIFKNTIFMLYRKLY